MENNDQTRVALAELDQSLAVFKQAVVNCYASVEDWKNKNPDWPDIVLQKEVLIAQFMQDVLPKIPAKVFAICELLSSLVGADEDIEHNMCAYFACITDEDIVEADNFIEEQKKKLNR